MSGITADEHMVDMGRGENPRFVLSVAARRLGSRNMFNASIINLESGTQLTGGSVNYDTLDDGIEAMERLTRELTGVTGTFPSAGGLEAVRDRAAALAAPCTGGTKGGGKKSGGAVVGYGVLNLGLGLGSFVQGDWGGGLTLLGGYGAAAGLIAWELSLEYEDPMAGIPGAIGLGVAGVTVLYGFIRPVLYHRSRALAVIADGIRITTAPGGAVRLSYTAKF